MSELLYMQTEAVTELNKVEGFEPSKFLRTICEEGQEDQFYLDVKYRKLWFRLKHPKGKIVKILSKVTEQMAIVEARIYFDKNDSSENFITNAFAQKYQTDGKFANKYVELAETAAVGRALSDAGFGVQFSGKGEESDPNVVDAGIPLLNGQMVGKNISAGIQQQPLQFIQPAVLGHPLAGTPVSDIANIVNGTVPT